MSSKSFSQLESGAGSPVLLALRHYQSGGDLGFDKNSSMVQGSGVEETQRGGRSGLVGGEGKDGEEGSKGRDGVASVCS